MQREIHMSSLAIFSNKPKSEQNKKKTSRMHDVIRFCVNNRSFIAIVLNEKCVDVNFHRDFQGGWVVEGLIKPTFSVSYPRQLVVIEQRLQKYL